MRIIGYIDHPEWKITLFKMDDKFSVKFEKPGFEQTFKIRQSEAIPDENALRKLINPDFLAAVNKQFDQMALVIKSALNQRETDREEDEFPEII